MKRRGLTAALILAVVVAAAGSGGAQDTKTPYVIDVITGLTGYGAFIAAGQVKAFAAVEKEVNDHGGVRGRPIHFDLVDDQSNPRVDLQLTAQLLTKKPALVIDGGPAAMCAATATLYAGGPVMYCLSPGFFPKPGGYVFGAGVASRDGMRVVVDYLRQAGYKRLGIMTLTDIAGQEADAALKELLAQPGNAALHPVAWEHFGPTDISVDAQMARIKEARPDVVIGWATGTPTGTLFQAYKNAGMTLPFIASQANENAQQMQRYGPNVPHDLLMYSLMWPAGSTLRPGPQRTAIETFRRAMQATGSDIGDSSSAECYDAAMILVSALRTLGPSATADQVHQYMLNLHDYYGASGRFDFRNGNPRGLGTNDAIVVRWDAPSASWQPVSAPGGAPLHSS